jgi:hypothetical protein
MNTRNNQTGSLDFEVNTLPFVNTLNKKPSNRKVRKWRKMKVLVGNYLVPRWVPSDKAMEMEEKLKIKMETKEMKTVQPTNSTTLPISGNNNISSVHSFPYSSSSSGQPTMGGGLNFQQLQVQQKMQQLQYQMQQQQQQQQYYK